MMFDKHQKEIGIVEKDLKDLMTVNAKHYDRSNGVEEKLFQLAKKDET